MKRRLQSLTMLGAVVVTALVLFFATPTSSQTSDPGPCRKGMTSQCETYCKTGIDGKIRCVTECICR
jgi:hypothetical protein